MRFLPFTSFGLLLTATLQQVASAQEPLLTTKSNLRAAATRLDITPPDGTPVVGHVRDVNGARDPLHAVLLLLDDSRTKAAIITLDLLNAGGDMTLRLREAISTGADIPPENIMVAASHNHSGPGWTSNEAWSQSVVQKVRAAARKAAGEMRTVSIGYQEDAIDFNINRRQMIGGRSVVRLNPDGPCDHRVKVLRFDDGQSIDPLPPVHRLLNPHDDPAIVQLRRDRHATFQLHRSALQAVGRMALDPSFRAHVALYRVVFHAKSFGGWGFGRSSADRTDYTLGAIGEGGKPCAASAGKYLLGVAGTDCSVHLMRRVAVRWQRVRNAQQSLRPWTLSDSTTCRSICRTCRRFRAASSKPVARSAAARFARTENWRLQPALPARPAQSTACPPATAST